MTDWLVMHDRIRGRAVCAIGAICGDAPIIAIGASDDDDDEPRAHAKRAGLRALRRFATKAAPIVTSAVPGGAAAREAAKALLEARRAAADVETHDVHGQAVNGLLSPLATRAIGQVEEPAPPRARALLADVNRLVERELWPMLAEIRRFIVRGGRNVNERARLERRMMPVVERFARLEDQILELGWSIYLVDEQHPDRSLYALERLATR